MKFGKIKIGILCAVTAVAATTALCACNKKTPKQYTVTFDTRGGTSISSYSLEAGANIRRPSAEPTKEMFVFNDWYTDTSYTQRFEFNTRMPAYDITIYAGWIGEASVVITYDANGGAYSDGANSMSGIGIVGDAFAAPSVNPTRVGYTFGGWFTDKACTEPYAFTAYPLDALTLYAGWNNDSSYAYYSYYGNGKLIETVPVKKGATVTAPDLFNGSSDIVTDGWYSDEDLTEKYTFGTASANVSLYSAYYTNGLTITDGKVVGYSGTVGDVVIPHIYDGVSVTEIGDYAFYRSSETNAITSVNLPDTVNKIGKGAFYDCRYLTDVNISSNVTAISDEAFYNNMRLKNFGDISKVITIGEAAFIGCKAIVELELPSALTSIGAYAFADCTALKEVTLPTGVRVVSDYMFSGCTSLQKVDLQSSVLSSIYNHTFERCSALKEVYIRCTQFRSTLFADAATTFESPFAYNADVTIYVPSGMIDLYKNEYGALDKGTLTDKLAVIG
ncbi:MAG: leucine-rich repeat protein [Clostridiales bacterium]|nr:leucine-rich repeat protein [Clostridiales bacterium]